ncbi:MAG TPA: hypothetical protein VF529_02000 [Solirubrobacteraceae bacterium]|jgi:hypothetical protein
MEPPRRPTDRAHGRRWRRDPFAPASFDRPRGAADEPPPEPREPGAKGDEAAGERPPSNG